MLMQVSAGRGRGPEVVGFYDPSTSSIQYLASDPETGHCAVIDPVLDYDAVTGSTSTGSADALLDVVRERGFEIAWILDTHPHADHLTAAHYLQGQTGAPTAIGARVVEMQRSGATSSDPVRSPATARSGTSVSTTATPSTSAGSRVGSSRLRVTRSPR